jgi:chromosome segregation ATPase
LDGEHIERQKRRVAQLEAERDSYNLHSALSEEELDDAKDKIQAVIDDVQAAEQKAAAVDVRPTEKDEQLEQRLKRCWRCVNAPFVCKHA